ncbi:hypothetical protein [Chryseobacterium sp. OSA05B]|uniref:hypothetical protein n=1 Tax=Chryseobacterium sp. OSA05B TaxID=2862650 RepID=UPI001CBB0685|nr:hypothetical protein [Chryseobacterium sp. OSA05B]
MPANNSPALILKGSGPGKPGLSFAGFEPDNLAGVTDFAIPPQEMVRCIFPVRHFNFLKQGNS